MELGIANLFAFGEFLKTSGIADLGAGGSPVGAFLEAVAGIGAAFVFHRSARIAHLARRISLRIRFRGRIAISPAGIAHAFLIALVIRAALIGVADFPCLTGQAVAKLLAGAGYCRSHSFCNNPSRTDRLPADIAEPDSLSPHSRCSCTRCRGRCSL